MPPLALQPSPDPEDVLVGAFVDGRWQYGTLESRTSVRLLHADPPRTCTVPHEDDLRLVRTTITVSDGEIVRLLDEPSIRRRSKSSEPAVRSCVRVALFASDMRMDPFEVVERALREAGWGGGVKGQEGQEGQDVSSQRWFADLRFADNRWTLWLDREMALAICGRGVRVDRKVVVCGMMLTDEEEVFPATPLWHDGEEEDEDGSDTDDFEEED